MPIMKRKYQFMKVYRPSGTRYAEGRSADPESALTLALEAFVDEFGELPPDSETNIEIIGVTKTWVAVVMHIKDL